MKANQIGVVVWLSCAITLAAATGAAGKDRMPMHLPASITVTGSGTVTAPPDTAELTTGVVTQAPSAAQALAGNNAAMEALLKSLRSLGIAQKDIQTTNITVTPQHRQGKNDSQLPEITGYEVANQIRVKVRDLSSLGRVLDELVTQEANVLSAIRFGVQEPTQLLDDARTKAMVDARRKAEVYANAAGVKLGRPLSVQEGGAVLPRPLITSRALMSAAVPVAPGEEEFQATISPRPRDIISQTRMLAAPGAAATARPSMSNTREAGSGTNKSSLICVPQTIGTRLLP